MCQWTGEGRINDKCSSPPQLLRIGQIEIKPFQPNSTCQSKVTLEHLHPPLPSSPPIFCFYLLKKFAAIHEINAKWRSEVSARVCACKDPFVSHQRPRSVIVTPISLNPQLRLTLKITICNACKSTHAVQTCMHTHQDQKLRGLLLHKNPAVCLSSSFCKRCSFLALITVVDIVKLPTVPGNYSTEPHNRGFDLLFNHLKCEYTLWSVNESLCCSTSVPYLDITVLIRWIKLISKSEHRRQCFGECWDGHSVSLMICLPSIQLDCYFTVISPALCLLTSPAMWFFQL